jgi:D-alanine--poly(phosphoribitol) ligase subunit 1
MTFQNLLHIIDKNEVPSDTFFLADSWKKVSWSEINELADIYAAEISKLPKDCRVIPFYPTRGIETIAFILACVRSERGFSPILEFQPKERIHSCLQALGCNFIVNLSPSFGVTREIEVAPLEVRKIDSGILYVLFTSGSTGAPKGVMVSTSNLLNTMLWADEIFHFCEDDVVGVVTDFSFDLSIFDVFTILMFRASGFILDLKSPQSDWAGALVSNQVNSLLATPGFFEIVSSTHLFATSGKDYTVRLLSAGDFLSPQLARKLLENSRKVVLYNLWGPTETTILNTCHLLDDKQVLSKSNDSQISIGRSTSRMRVELFDLHRDTILVEDNLEGELVVLGESVSLGYLTANEEDFLKFFVFEGVRAFRTGDIGIRRGKDFYMVGRSKTLIKFGGYRIDPREIEALVNLLPGINRSVFTLGLDAGGTTETQLICSIETNKILTISSIKNHLRLRLPSYMIPKKVLFTEESLLTKNGKLDRNLAQIIGASNQGVAKQ